MSAVGCFTVCEVDTVCDHFTIGRHGRPVSIPFQQGWSYFNGKIDEVRVSGRAQGADWIRLCYMNQKADDVLTVIRQ